MPSSGFVNSNGGAPKQSKRGGSNTERSYGPQESTAGADLQLHVTLIASSESLVLCLCTTVPQKVPALNPEAILEEIQDARSNHAQGLNNSDHCSSSGAVDIEMFTIGRTTRGSGTPGPAKCLHQIQELFAKPASSVSLSGVGTARRTSTLPLLVVYKSEPWTHISS